MFQNASPLRQRESGGAMDKREAQSVTYSALRQLAKPIMINGNLSNTRGFETVVDNIIEVKRFYCMMCGTLKRDNDNSCRICKIDFVASATNLVPRLSNEKFELTCQSCALPFYVKGKITSEAETFQKENGFRFDVCFCYVELRKEYAQNLRWQLARKRELKREKVRVYRASCPEALLLKNKIAYAQATSREAKKRLSREKVALLKLLAQK